MAETVDDELWQTTRDYLSLRKAQKQARAEMWHVWSHHPELEKEWGHLDGGCWRLLKLLLDWEPADG